LNSNQTANTDRPTVFECDLWTTFSSTSSGAINSGSNPTFGMTSSQQREGSIVQFNLKLRQDTIALYASVYPYYSVYSSFTGSGAQYFKSIVYYCNTPGVLYYPLANNTSQIEDIQLLGPYANETGVYFLAGAGQFVVDLSEEGITYDSLNPMLLYYYNAAFTAPLNYLCQTNLQAVQVRDSEGLKTVDSSGNVYFKTGGSLKINSGNHGSTNSTPLYAYKLIGVLEKPATPFTVSFTLKVDAGAEANWDTLAVQYGPNANQIVEQALTPTSSFATYTMSIDPANYTDWLKFSFPIYFGIRSKAANIFASEVHSYAYIQSVTVA
jgi:hypothetical protein